MVVPLRLHGNGVPAAQHRGHSLDILSLHSLVGFSSGSLWDSKGLVLAMVDGQDEGPLPRSKLNGCCLANYYVVLSDVPLEQKPFDRCTGNTKGSLWQRGSAFAFFEVAADLASVIIWPTCNNSVIQSTAPFLYTAAARVGTSAAILLGERC